MGFQITTTRQFSAAHALRLYDGSLEPVHGHNWRVKVTVSAAKLDEIGVVMDFHVLEKLVDAVLEPLHNRHLNEVAPFNKELNPSAENVALHVGRSLHLPALDTPEPVAHAPGSFNASASAEPAFTSPERKRVGPSITTAALDRVQLVSVEVWETDSNSAVYLP